MELSQSFILYNIETSDFFHSEKDRTALTDKFGIISSPDQISVHPDLLALGTYNPYESKFLFTDGQIMQFDTVSWKVFMPVVNSDIVTQYPIVLISSDNLLLFCAIERFPEVLQLVFAKGNPSAGAFLYGNRITKRKFPGREREKEVSHYTFVRSMGKLNAFPSKFNFKEIRIGESDMPSINGENILMAVGSIGKWWEDFNGNRIFEPETVSDIHERFSICRLENYFIRTENDLVTALWEEDPVINGTLQIDGYSILAPGVYLQKKPDMTWIGGVFPPHYLTSKQEEYVSVELETKGHLIASIDIILRAIARKARYSFWKNYIITRDDYKAKEKTAPAKPDPVTVAPKNLFSDVVQENAHLQIFTLDIKEGYEYFGKSADFEGLLKKYPIHDGITLGELSAQPYWSSLQNEPGFKNFFYRFISNSKDGKEEADSKE